MIHSNFIDLHLIKLVLQVKEILIRTASGIVFLIIVLGSILLHPMAFLLHPMAFLVVFGGFTLLGMKEYFNLTDVSSGHLRYVYALVGLLLYFLLGLIGTGALEVVHRCIVRPSAICICASRLTALLFAGVDRNRFFFFP